MTARTATATATATARTAETAAPAKPKMDPASDRWRAIPRRLRRLVGTVILASYVLMLYAPLSQSPLSPGFRGCGEATTTTTTMENSCPSCWTRPSSSSHSLPSSIVPWSIFVCGALNAASHCLVVFGFLDSIDTLVISVLIGVGFDVLSRVLFDWTWACCVAAAWSSRLQWDHATMATVAFAALYGLSAIGFYVVHVRALIIFWWNGKKGIEGIETVVRENSEAIRGESTPALLVLGFTDLGTHVFQMTVAWKVLGHAPGVVALALAALYAGGVWWHVNNCGEERGEVSLPEGSFLYVDENDEPKCRCAVCAKRMRAFTVDLCNWQFCKLWFCSFPDMFEQVSNAKNTKLKAQ